MRYLIILLISLSACFGIQSLALRAAGGKTVKSESNFFSSLARIQTGMRNSPNVMLLGSSMTGRLPDRSQGFAGVANLGCDGGNAIDVLRAMDRGELHPAPLLIIEGNTFDRSLQQTESEISRALRSPWFRAGIKAPLLGASARPSAFAYSKLLAQKIGESPGPEGQPLPTTSIPCNITQPPHLTPEEKALALEVSSILKRLGSRGTAAAIAIIPKAIDVNSPNHRISRAVAHHAGIPFWDLNDGLADDTIRFTDGIHMAPLSAGATLRSLLGICSTQS